MPKDYSTWLTKQQAADAIGVSTKTIEKLADGGKLQQQTWKRAGKPAIAVYHPDDVERERQERNPDAEPFVLPPAEPQNVKSTSETLALAPTSQNTQNPLGMFAAMAAAMRPATPRLFMTIDEASDYSGLPRGYLRALIKEGKIGLKTGSGWRIKRADLDAL